MRDRNLIGGDWTTARSGARRAVLDPATDEVIAEVAWGDAEDATAAIEAAYLAFPEWSARTASERAEPLRRLAAAMLEAREELATLLTREQGKPLTEARAEVTYAASFLDWAADEGKRVYGELVPSSRRNQRIMVLKQPIGVTACITPWNFPLAMIARKLGPALAAGNTMIVKPSEETPLSALALGELAMSSGIPAGVMNVVVGEAASIGERFLQDSRVRKLSFTGSTLVGRSLMRGAADQVKRLSLELGGHAPFIVFDDADVSAAVEGALTSKLRNMGQTCVASSRFYVQAQLYDRFVEKLLGALSELKLGPGLEEGVKVGPLISDRAVEKVSAHVADAEALGAKLRLGGRAIQPRPGLTGRFFLPTLLEDFTPTMRLACEETFGPVLPVRRFSDEAQVLEEANRSEYGLAAYVYTRDASRAWRFAEGLEYGIVSVNDGAPSTAQAPFGGMKQSGFGREGGKYVMDEYLETKYVSWIV